MPRKLPAEFYLRDDVVQVSRDLLGKVLCTKINGAVTKAVITETEAYAGIDDRASHAFGDRRTKRTAPMYGPGGHAYVYLCYGIHHLFNVVTNIEGIPHAVLVRAGRPREGVETMVSRRGKKKADGQLMAGPGTISQALGVTTELTGTNLRSGTIWIEDHDIAVHENDVIVGPRVGVDYAADDARRPYRFRTQN